MGIASRTLTAVENLIGAISTASKMSRVSFGGTETNSWMINLLGLLASNTAGRGMDVIGTPYPLGIPIEIWSVGAGGGAGYGGAKRDRFALQATNRARTAVGAVICINQQNAGLAVTGTPWIRFGYTTDGYSSVTYITDIAAVTTHTAFAITVADIPDDALLFCEVSAGAGEFIAGTALIELR